jgi:hypothetical protein
LSLAIGFEAIKTGSAIPDTAIWRVASTIRGSPESEKAIFGKTPVFLERKDDQKELNPCTKEI